MKKSVQVYLEPELYAAWRERYQYTTFSSWARNQVIAAVKGLDYIVARKEQELEETKNSLENGQKVAQATSDLQKQLRAEKAKMANLSTQALQDIEEWKKLHAVSQNNPKDPYASARAISKRNVICAKYGLTVADLVAIAAGKKAGEDEIEQQRQ